MLLVRVSHEENSMTNGATESALSNVKLNFLTGMSRHDLHGYTECAATKESNHRIAHKKFERLSVPVTFPGR